MDNGRKICVIDPSWLDGKPRAWCYVSNGHGTLLATGVAGLLVTCMVRRGATKVGSDAVGHGELMISVTP